MKEWEGEKNHHEAVIEQAKNRLKDIDEKWDELSLDEKDGKTGKDLLQEKGEQMDHISKSRKELAELDYSK